MDGVYELQAEQTVMTHCRQMLVTNPDPAYVSQYITHSLPQHRQFLCAGAWMLMDVDRPESISIANLVSCHSTTFNIFNLSLTFQLMLYFLIIAVVMNSSFGENYSLKMFWQRNGIQTWWLHHWFCVILYVIVVIILRCELTFFWIFQGRALKELSPEEVTTNVYNMVDVLLNHIHLQLKHGHSLQVHWLSLYMNSCIRPEQ